MPVAPVVRYEIEVIALYKQTVWKVVSDIELRFIVLIGLTYTVAVALLEQPLIVEVTV